MIILQALLGSFWVKAIGAAFAALLAVKAYGLAKEWQGEAKGAAKVVAAATKKADANVSTAERVGAAVEAGRKGAKNPYTRIDP